MVIKLNLDFFGSFSIKNPSVLVFFALESDRLPLFFHSLELLLVFVFFASIVTNIFNVFGAFKDAHVLKLRNIHVEL
jgi:hypothetical protein